MKSPFYEFVRARAQERCEYCHMRQSIRRLHFQIDHVIARQHRGTTDIENLALACGQCNRLKGPNLSGVDPLTMDVVRLFDPRRQRWEDHFEFEGAMLVGKTSIGRTTVATLGMNMSEELKFREWLLARGISLAD